MEEQDSAARKYWKSVFILSWISTTKCFQALNAPEDPVLLGSLCLPLIPAASQVGSSSPALPPEGWQRTSCVSLTVT